MSKLVISFIVIFLIILVIGIMIQWECFGEDGDLSWQRIGGRILYPGLGLGYDELVLLGVMSAEPGETWTVERISADGGVYWRREEEIAQTEVTEQDFWRKVIEWMDRR